MTPARSRGFADATAGIDPARLALCLAVATVYSETGQALPAHAVESVEYARGYVLAAGEIGVATLHASALGL